jgi:hypothetical protein
LRSLSPLDRFRTPLGQLGAAWSEDDGDALGDESSSTVLPTVGGTWFEEVQVTQVQSDEERRRRAQESRVRRALARRGERLWKPRSRYQWEYGPYAVVDVARNEIVAWGCDLDELERELRDGL